MNPRVVTVRLIVGSYCTGKGIEGDPMRTVECLYTEDGHLVCSRDVLTNEAQVGYGASKVRALPSNSASQEEE